MSSFTSTFFGTSAETVCLRRTVKPKVSFSVASRQVLCKPICDLLPKSGTKRNFQVVSRSFLSSGYSRNPKHLSCKKLNTPSLQASRKDEVGASSENYFPEESEFVQAFVDKVGHTSTHAPVIFLKMADESDLVLPIFIGEAELLALETQINRHDNSYMGRPMTYELMKNTIETLNYKVERVAVVALKDNTFYATITLSTDNANRNNHSRTLKDFNINGNNISEDHNGDEDDNGEIAFSCNLEYNGGSLSNEDLKATMDMEDEDDTDDDKEEEEEVEDGVRLTHSFVHIDSRPSDALNLALRFQAPIYVHKEVLASSAYTASKRASQLAPYQQDESGGSKPGSKGSSSEGKSGHHQDDFVEDIFNKLRQQAKKRRSPVLDLRWFLAMAVTEERYEDAARIRDEIAKVLGDPRAATLLFQLEKAIVEEDYTEAARCRDELAELDAVIDTVKMSRDSVDDDEDLY